jgi:hypothetical protein
MDDYGYWKNISQNNKAATTFQNENTKVVNVETGEDLTDKYQIMPKKLVSHQQVNYRKRKEAMARYAEEHGGFIFTFHRLREFIGKELKQADLGRLLFLATYIGFQDNRLMYDNNRPINKSGLKTLLMLKKDAFRTFYNAVTALEIIIERDGYLCMNERYFYKGALADDQLDAGNRTYTRTFIKSVRSLYEEYGATRKASQLGLLYLVIPFIHVDTNILASNPDEDDLDEIDALSLEELAEAIGYAKNKISRSLRSIFLGGEYVFQIVNVGTNHEKNVVVHPAIFWRGNSIPDLTKTMSALSRSNRRREMINSME